MAAEQSQNLINISSFQGQFLPKFHKNSAITLMNILRTELGEKGKQNCAKTECALIVGFIFCLLLFNIQQY